MVVEQTTSHEASSPTAVLAVLSELEAVLEREATALATLDFAAIDAATQAKDEIAIRLNSQRLDPVEPGPQAENLRRRRDSVLTRAKANETRLQATLVAVRGLLNHLVGDPSPTYGRSSGDIPVSRAVLTSVVG